MHTNPAILGRVTLPLALHTPSTEQHDYISLVDSWTQMDMYSSSSSEQVH